MSVIIIILLYICKCVSCGLLDDFPESFGDFFSKDFDFKLPNVSGLQPEFYAFEPKGFRVEVPVAGDTNVGLFKFRGKLNGKLEDTGGEDINGIVSTARYGKWIYEDPNIELKIGDKIDYDVSLTLTVGIAAHTNIAKAEWEVTKYDNRRRCAEPITVATGIENDFCNGNLIFEDDFSQASINRNKWNVQQYIPSITDDDHYEFVSYQDKVENLFLRNSILYLKPTPAISKDGVLGTLDLTEECTRRKQISCNYAQIGGNILPPIVSARILSRVAFKYGKIEIKAKVPMGDWIYPQIELIPKGKLPAYPRILLAYTRGNLNLTLDNGEDIGNTLLLGGPVNSPEELGKSQNLRNIRLPTPLGQDMRTYTVQWSPFGIEFQVDSETYGSVTNSEYPSLNTEYQIALGVGVGGQYDFPDSIQSGNYAKPWTNFEPLYLKHFYDGRSFWEKTWNGDDVALRVDSVKVWALNTDQECELSKTLYENGQHPCKGVVIFEDNFTDNVFNDGNWVIENYIPTYDSGPDYEFVAYERNNKTLWLNESKLFINPLALNNENNVKGILDLGDKCTSGIMKQCRVEKRENSILPPVKSAKISTKLNFTYGKIEIKAKLPLGDWIYPQIQLLPRDLSKIDTKMWIAYSRGNSYYIGPDGDIGSTVLFGGLVYGNEEPERSRLTSKRKSFIPYGEEMHTYTLIWEPDKITVMFDNETYGSYMIDPTDSRFKELQSTEFYLSIGVGVGGINDFPDKYTSNNPKPWTNDMPTRVKSFFDARNMWLPTWRQQMTRLEVDSVTVWAL